MEVEVLNNQLDPFVAYVVEHDLSGSKYALARSILELLGTGQELEFGEIMTATGQSRINLAKRLRQLLALTNKYFELYGFKVDKNKGGGKSVYKIVPYPGRPVEPKERDRKYFDVQPRGPVELEIGSEISQLKKRIAIALEERDMQDLEVLDRPDEELDDLIDNSSWFFDGKYDEAIVREFAESAKKGNALNTLELQNKLGLPNEDFHIRDLETYSFRHPAELGFVIKLVRTNFYTVCQFGRRSRINALRDTYTDEEFRMLTYLDKLEPLNLKKLIHRLNAEEVSIDETQKKLALKVANAQLEGRHLKTPDALKAIGFKKNSRCALHARISNSKRERFQTGFFLRYRVDSTLECCLLDSSADMPMSIKPIGVQSNY